MSFGFRCSAFGFGLAATDSRTPLHSWPRRPLTLQTLDALCHDYPNGRVCANDIHWGIPVVPGAAPHREIHPAVVRGRRGCLADLDVVFPGVAFGRLRVCALHVAVAQAPHTGNRASGSAGDRPGPAAYHAERLLEAARGWQSDPANPHTAGGEPWAALFRAVVHWPAHPAMVQPGQARRVAVPALCAIESRLAAGPLELPFLFRDAFHPQVPSRVVGLGISRLCHLLRLLCG